MKSLRELVKSLSPERQARINRRTEILSADIQLSNNGRLSIKTEILVKRRLNRLAKTQVVMKELWEILVPQADSEGEFIAIPEHNVWDGMVRKITGGLTIHRSALGNWVSPEGELVVERMIPVRISCTEEEMHKIGRMTKEFYRQAKVMYYRVSDKVFII